MLKYCQNCNERLRGHAVTNVNFMDVCGVCAAEIMKEVQEQKKEENAEPISEGVRRYLKAKGIRT